MRSPRPRHLHTCCVAHILGDVFLSLCYLMVGEWGPFFNLFHEGSSPVTLVLHSPDAFRRVIRV